MPQKGAESMALLQPIDLPHPPPSDHAICNLCPGSVWLFAAPRHAEHPEQVVHLFFAE
jgi:hypothetical protein